MSTVVVDRLGLVVQMRLDSSRLPRKALLPLGPGSLAYAVMHRLKAVHADDYILATDDAGAIELAEAASLAGFALFAGPKDDVLLRYVLAASEFGLSRIMRATGDNPFVSVPLADMLAQRNRENQADYAGFIGMPVGMGVELIRVEALKRACEESSDPYDHEHVCPYLYRNPTVFRVDQPQCPVLWHAPDKRLTVDTEADYHFAQAIVSELGSDPDDEAIMRYLNRKHRA